jgi:TolB-like protein
MTRTDSTGNEARAGSAADRFVSVDAGEQGADVALASWLDERPEHERALLRVELAAALARRLAAHPGSALYAEAAQAARLASLRRPWGRALAWGGALAASVLVAIFVVRDGGSPAVAPESTPIEAARVVTFDAPTNVVAVLPTGAVVDAGAVAVLPFVASGDATLAAGLERDVVAALRDVPGLYVIADEAVRPYVATELAAPELGGLLGARGIVDASVELGGGRVRVSAQLRDAATGATLWRTDVDRPVDELSAVRHEIAERVAATMLDSSLREQVVRTDRSSAPVSSSKPLQQ